MSELLEADDLTEAEAQLVFEYHERRFEDCDNDY